MLSLASRSTRFLFIVFSIESKHTRSIKKERNKTKTHEQIDRMEQMSTFHGHTLNLVPSYRRVSLFFAI